MLYRHVLVCVVNDSFAEAPGRERQRRMTAATTRQSRTRPPGHAPTFAEFLRRRPEIVAKRLSTLSSDFVEPYF
eukprot:259196-Prymnesium_polylepis.1